jgi:hypothetical protein
MSGSSRSRQKRKLEPISIEELAGTTGMSGFCSFLTRDAAVPVPALDKLESPELIEEPAQQAIPSAPDSPAHVLTAPILPAPDRTALEPPAPVFAAPQPSALETAAPELTTPAAVPPLALTVPDYRPVLDDDSSAEKPDAPDWGAVEPSALVSPVRRRVRIREAATVQDAHSLAEQAVYDAMYRAGRPYQGDSRVLTIGLRSLAELSRMAYSNCKANVRSLVAKLAIDERPGFSYTDGRTYLIYSFREILRRRKAAGLTHVIRTRGVAFVDPKTGRELLQSSAPDSRALDGTAPEFETSAPERDQTGAPPTPESSAPGTPSHIRNRNFNRNYEQESSSDIRALVSALRRYAPDVDDDAAADLWQRCLANAPDARIEEIVHMIHLKAGKPGIRLPLGFLLAAVPKCFKGDSYRQFRADRERSREAARARDRLFAAEILKSPEADEEQKLWAREVLESA